MPNDLRRYSLDYWGWSTTSFYKTELTLEINQKMRDRLNTDYLVLVNHGESRFLSRSGERTLGRKVSVIRTLD